VGAIFIQPGNLFGRFETAGLAGSLFLVMTGMCLRIWGSGVAGVHTRTGTIEAARLITGGPYAYVRNPIYLGSIILGFGMVGLLGDGRLFVIHLVVFAAMYFSIIPAEEQFLRKTFARQFPAYALHVPRLIPRLTRWRGAEPGRIQWKATRGEVSIALLLVLIYVALRFIADLRSTVQPF
jgi:protein-S-isoprenylcysteine O-methyltransferase Ste14